MIGITDISYYLLIILPVIYSLQLMILKIRRKDIKLIPETYIAIVMLLISGYFIAMRPFEHTYTSLIHYLSAPLTFCFSPLIYFYFKNSLLPTQIRTRRIRIKALIHFTPFLIFLAVTLVSYYDILVLFGNISLAISSVLFLSQVVTYSILMNKHFKDFRTRVNNKNKFFQKLKQGIHIFIFLYIAFCVFCFLLFFFQPKIASTVFLPIVFLYITFLNCFVLWKHSKNTEIAFANLKVAYSFDVESVKISNDLLITQEKMFKLKKKLFDIMENKEAYLDPFFSINSLCKMLKTNRTYISFILNHEFNENFNTFVNRYRINRAKELLTDENYNKYKIEWIAQRVGFRSKTSFNQHFKTHTGLTPSEYRNKYMVCNNL